MTVADWVPSALILLVNVATIGFLIGRMQEQTRSIKALMDANNNFATQMISVVTERLNRGFVEVGDIQKTVQALEVALAKVQSDLTGHERAEFERQKQNDGNFASIDRRLTEQFSIIQAVTRGEIGKLHVAAA